jgi:acylglycerol lipase
MKFELWGKEVDLDYPNKESFLSTVELEEVERNLDTCQHEWMQSKTGEWLHCRKFLPPAAAPKAVVVFCHCIQTHSGKGLIVMGRKLSTTLLVEHFVNTHGFALYALDLLGHGFSEGTRAYVPNVEIHKSDLSALAEKAQEENPGVPLFLLGHSYGASLSIFTAVDYWQDKPNFGGLLLLATATEGDMPNPIVVFILADVLAKCFPKSTPFFMPNPVSTDRIWRDEEVRKANCSTLSRKLDSSGTPFCLGTAAQLIRALQVLRDVVIPKLKAPYIAIHGSADYAVPVSDVDYLEQYAATPKADRTVVILEGAYHDLLADPAAEETLQHIDLFVAKRMEQLKTA